MINFHSLLALVLTLSFSQPYVSVSQEINTDAGATTIQKVGMTNRKFTDNKRSNWRGTGPKSINTIVWYPADEGAAPESLIGPFVKVPVVQEGKISKKSRKYPLILFSHGAGGEALHMIAWGHYLAARGYIVASINHKGNSKEEPQMGAFSLADRQMWHRPQDLTAVLNQILKDPTFGPYIDTEKIAVGGFSLGGYTAIAMAGAILDMEELKAKSDLESLPLEIRRSIDAYIELLKKDSILQESLKHSGDSFKDRRIKGAFALAPAIGEGFTKAGLGTVDVPVYIVVGEKDVITPKELNAQLYANGIKDARLTVLPGEVGHITKPDPVADQNWVKVFNLSYRFFEELWSKKHQ